MKLVNYMINPLTVDELNYRKSIVNTYKEKSYLVTAEEPLIIWKDYYALEMCLTECNYAVHPIDTFQHFLDRYQHNVVKVKVKFNEHRRSDTKVLYNLHEYVGYKGNHSLMPLVRMYMKLHSSRQDHPIYGQYVAWTTPLLS